MTTNSSTSEKKRAHEGGAVTKKGVRREIGGGRSAHRRPNDLLTNERSTEISFILHYLFPLSQSRCYPFFPFPSSTSRTHYLSLSHRHIFDDEQTNTERITDPSSYGSHRHGPSRHCEYTCAGIALSAGNREKHLSNTKISKYFHNAKYYRTRVCKISSEAHCFRTGI